MRVRHIWVKVKRKRPLKGRFISKGTNFMRFTWKRETWKMKPRKRFKIKVNEREARNVVISKWV